MELLPDITLPGLTLSAVFPHDRVDTVVFTSDGPLSPVEQSTILDLLTEEFIVPESASMHYHQIEVEKAMFNLR